MTQEAKDKLYQKLGEAGLLVLVLATIVYFLYQDNQRYREDNNMRIEKLENRIETCAEENLKILREDLNRSRDVIEKNTKALEIIINKY
jgi:type VI protein secretion system component VasK